MQNMLQRAMEDCFPVDIIYMKKSEFTKRTILVKQIKNGYVKAFCFQKRQIRMFKSEAILAVLPHKKRTNPAYYA
ncbi:MULTISPECIES: hypothetical protein [Bacillus]|uniref:hypothetical protein n=1 Tax=Bacillus TaxID=1386 RepID=UPI0004166E68|nr:MULTISPECIES: hypothetical protein [Bacillus]QHZ48885.1 WYL domain-containing protein [Bacillus sp. NSP9.1]